MKTLRNFSLEVSRLLQSRLTWLILLLTVISPVAGLTLYKSATAETMLSMYLANPAIAGGVVSGILFGLLTIYEMDRSGRSRVDILMNAIVSPMRSALIRMLALIVTSLLGLFLTMLIWLPVTFAQAGSVLDMTNYCLAYLLFMGLALPCSILAAAACY